ncbi:hypothetical protein CDAR_600891 [Caerostris darwini]|uniref:Cytochrome c biogenesis B n=1 Tax=Caerostris darwini TaxID=1538125 RepID=A0AAV4TYC3_9ARAC|nr:hypothetical protein CDAR_600891 [Caerostris darwini]
MKNSDSISFDLGDLIVNRPFSCRRSIMSVVMETHRDHHSSILSLYFPVIFSLMLAPHSPIPTLKFNLGHHIGENSALFGKMRHSTDLSL